MRNATLTLLLDQMRNRIHTKHNRLRTKTNYVDWIKRFMLFPGKWDPMEILSLRSNRFC